MAVWRIKFPFGTEIFADDVLTQPLLRLSVLDRWGWCYLPREDETRKP